MSFWVTKLSRSLLSLCLETKSNYNSKLLVKNLSNMTKKAVVFLAPGAEEMEFVVSVDVLRRGNVDVKVAGLPDGKPVTCSRGVVITPDISVEDVRKTGPYDALVLPGGLGGSNALAESKEIGCLLKDQYDSGRIVAAICAAPTALKAHGIGLGKNITSYPSVETKLTKGEGYVYKQDDVVVDGNIITSRGPGTSFKFALTLVEKLVGKEKAAEVAKAMLVKY